MLKKAEFQQIKDMIAAAQFALRPAGLVAVIWDLVDDCMGESSIQFMCTITDESVGSDRLLETTQHISESIRQIVEPEEYGLRAYFNFRSESEAKAAQEKTSRRKQAQAGLEVA